MLIFFDVDGTLFSDAVCKPQERALYAAAEAVFGRELSTKVNPAGKTDFLICGEAARLAGVTKAEIEARLAACEPRTVELFRSLCPTDTLPDLAPGISAALDALAPEHELAVITGNFREICELKLSRAGIRERFEFGFSGFGSDAHDRAEIVACALRRADAQGAPAERLILGDTKRDIAVARAHGLPVIAIAGPLYSARELHEADRVARHASEIPALVAELAGAR